MSPEKKRAKHSPVKTGKLQGGFKLALPIRLGIAAVLLIISVLFHMPTIFKIILLIVSAVVAGYDIFLSSVDAVAAKQFFSTDLVVVFAAVLSFVIGFAAEGTAMVLLYQLSKLLIDYTKKLSYSSALGLVPKEDQEFYARVEAVVSDEESGRMKLQKTIDDSATFILRFIFALALLYALLMPFIAGISFRVSIHRALMILLVSSPLSVSISFPVVAITALCNSAKNGIFFRDAEVLENATQINVALFDKAGVFSEEAPHLIGLQSDLLDKKTFLNFLAHAVYYSDQPFANAISDYFDQDYRLDVISNFRDIPGTGVALQIGGADVILATRAYFDREGIEIPDRSVSDGISYYMTVSGRYVGRVVVSAEINPDAGDLVDRMLAVGVGRNILLTEDDEEQSQSLAAALHFSEVIGECDVDKKLRLINDIASNGQYYTTFIYANGIEGHSAADLDIRVNRKGKYADALVLPECYLNIPTGIQLGKRAKELIAENAIASFVVKAILIFLSFLGYSSLWFVVFIDLVTALATMLNASRVSSQSLLKKTDKQS